MTPVDACRWRSAHSTGSPAQYAPDVAFLREYRKSVESARRAKDRAPVMKHLDKFVDGCRTHDDYLALIGGDALARLCMGYENAR